MLEKDDVYFIPPYIEHTISAINKTKYEYVVLYINNNSQKYSNNSLCKYVFKDKILRMTILTQIQKYRIWSNIT